MLCKAIRGFANYIKKVVGKKMQMCEVVFILVNLWRKTKGLRGGNKHGGRGSQVVGPKKADKNRCGEKGVQLGLK